MRIAEMFTGEMNPEFRWLLIHGYHKIQTCYCIYRRFYLKPVEHVITGTEKEENIVITFVGVC